MQQRLLNCKSSEEWHVHCRKQKLEYTEPTPKRRLRGKRGSSVPMDVTNTNFLTFACVAAAIRFLVPCATHSDTQIKACMEVKNSATTHLQAEMHMHAPSKGHNEPAIKRHTLLQTHCLVTNALPLFRRTTWAVLKHEQIVPVMLV